MVVWLCERRGWKEKEIELPKLHKQIFTQNEKKIKKWNPKHYNWKGKMKEISFTSSGFAGWPVAAG